MANLKYDKEITALLLIDPYNDFISEGGKVWNRLKTGLIAHPCVEATVRYAAELGYEVTMVKRTANYSDRENARCSRHQYPELRQCHCDHR